MARTVRVALESIAGGEHAIAGAPAHYLTRVLRLREGASFTAFDPLARIEAEATLVALGANGVRARFAEPVAARVVGLAGVTLVQCAGKGDKVDDVVRAATALGASRVVLALSERSVVRGAASDERSARLRAIALDAARQSGRGDLPEVAGPLPLHDVLSELAEQRALKLCLDPVGNATLGAA
ncbi:MAG TPA: RsmE family RNA methyltransferase, partial [Polyangiaceae bacterium]|nr:RsmE family RNA methyltransferase [Polyangiaceae bacterium]